MPTFTLPAQIKVCPEQPAVEVILGAYWWFLNVVFENMVIFDIMDYIYLCFYCNQLRINYFWHLITSKKLFRSHLFVFMLNKYYAKMQTSQNAPCVIIFCILDLTRKEGIYLHYECDDEVSQKTTFDECKGYWRLITIYVKGSWDYYSMRFFISLSSLHLSNGGKLEINFDALF